MTKQRDPVTREEWQEAVDVARGLLAIESARMYGLIKGGPQANIRRCEDILARGQKIGIRPHPAAIEVIAKEFS